MLTATDLFELFIGEFTLFPQEVADFADGAIAFGGHGTGTSTETDWLNSSTFVRDALLVRVRDRGSLDRADGEVGDDGAAEGDGAVHVVDAHEGLFVAVGGLEVTLIDHSYQAGGGCRRFGRLEVGGIERTVGIGGMRPGDAAGRAFPPVAFRDGHDGGSG
jgi:hypothetical protein